MERATQTHTATATLPRVPKTPLPPPPPPGVPLHMPTLSGQQLHLQQQRNAPGPHRHPAAEPAWRAWKCWAARTRKRTEACGGPPECGGEWTAKTVKRPPRQPARPPVCQLLGSTNTETTPAQTQAAEHSNPTQHAKGRMGDCPGPREETATQWTMCPRKRGEAGGRRPECGGEWAAKTEKRPPHQPAQPQAARNIRWSPNKWQILETVPGDEQAFARGNVLWKQLAKRLTRTPA